MRIQRIITRAGTIAFRDRVQHIRRGPARYDDFTVTKEKTPAATGREILATQHQVQHYSKARSVVNDG